MSRAQASISKIEDTILLIRKQKIIIDADLARLYGVSTKRLNEQIRRNIYKFPEDFMFQLNEDERNELVANCDQFKNLKHSSKLPFAFTEHGIIMAANVLNSTLATEISIYIVRTFVNLRKSAISHSKIDELEQNILTHDNSIRTLFTAIREIIALPKKTKRKIGFKIKK
jgi:hypothetical protein